jgi:hypothetical protein
MSTPATPLPPPPQDGQQSPGQQFGQQPNHERQPPHGYEPMPGVATSAQHAEPTGELGRIRPTGMIILLVIVTLGTWAFVYYYQVFEEMHRHSGRGLGGVLGLVIAIFVGVLPPFLLSNEVGQLYERRGRQGPVSALTGLWFFPGMLILVGPFIWFVKTNRALNEYWQGLGVSETTLV